MHGHLTLHFTVQLQHRALTVKPHLSAWVYLLQYTINKPTFASRDVSIVDLHEWGVLKYGPEEKKETGLNRTELWLLHFKIRFAANKLFRYLCAPVFSCPHVRRFT